MYISKMSRSFPCLLWLKGQLSAAPTCWWAPPRRVGTAHCSDTLKNCKLRALQNLPLFSRKKMSVIAIEDLATDVFLIRG